MNKKKTIKKALDLILCFVVAIMIVGGIFGLFSYLPKPKTLAEINCEDMSWYNIIGYADANGDGIPDKICSTMSSGLSTHTWFYYQKRNESGSSIEGLIRFNSTIANHRGKASCEVEDNNKDGYDDIVCIVAHGGGRFESVYLYKYINFSYKGMFSDWTKERL